jgi:uncharacterized phage protein (TIGR01671 family)
MREILFRGKRADNGEWVYGYLTNKRFGIATETIETSGTNDDGTRQLDLYGVVPETVGQYTGLTDVNGKKIFEGDIVKSEVDLWHNERKKERVARIGEVIYDKELCQFGTDVKGFSKCFTLRRLFGGFNEVIGNIHDNPELLKVGD